MQFSSHLSFSLKNLYFFTFRSIESKRIPSDSSKVVNYPEIKIDSSSLTSSSKISNVEVRKEGVMKSNVTLKVAPPIPSSGVRSGKLRGQIFLFIMQTFKYIGFSSLLSGFKSTSSSPIKQNPKSSVSILPLGPSDSPVNIFHRKIF